MCLHANNKLTLEVLHMSACILGTHTGCFTYVCMHTTNTHWQFYMCLHTTNTLEVLHVSACIQRTHTGSFKHVCMHATNTHWKFYMCLHAYTCMHTVACTLTNCIVGTKREKPKVVRFWFKILAGNLCLKIKPNHTGHWS